MFRINRNRVEFKALCSQWVLCSGNRINRNRVEFKASIHHVKFLAFFVLIETEWNLKYKYKEDYDMGDFGINRNRVEFKVENIEIGGRNIVVLIETEWNLKFQQ